MGSLTYSMAVFNETLRMFPPCRGYDARHLQPAGEKLTVPIPQGTYILLTSPVCTTIRDTGKIRTRLSPCASLEIGPRCVPTVQRRSSRLCGPSLKTEAVAVLSLIVSCYTIEVKEEPQFAAETFEQRRERLLKCSRSLTIYPVRTPLVFKRR
ncbi:hypothetical protein A0H81_02160 [Grifola frondosa]|uniref:Uncharacterized protein n=1 Tax=Grifola frondosa TaxID=5627 RepID=A0A1C7MP33_GRIFR|nr:hypothetical protein A0H81_02160 [Grifola frondosa]